jgi:hypothetical protein
MVRRNKKDDSNKKEQLRRSRKALELSILHHELISTLHSK